MTIIETTGIKCRVCGCTDENPCLNGCAWVLTKDGKEDLCSTCLNAAHAIAEWTVLIPDRMTISPFANQEAIGWPDRFARLATEATIQLFIDSANDDQPIFLEPRKAQA